MKNYTANKIKDLAEKVSEDAWTEAEMKLIIRWQKDRIKYGVTQLKKALDLIKKMKVQMQKKWIKILNKR